MPVKIEVDTYVDPVTGHDVLTGIPMDFYYQFRKNPSAACRDIAALVRAAVSPYFDQKSRVVGCMKQDRINPFLEDSLQFEDWFSCKDRWQHFLHFDLAVTRCAAGIAMCSTPGFVIRHANDGREVRVPYVVVDFLGRVTAPIGQEIDLISLGNLPFMIQDLGFDLALVTYDRYESRQNIQRLKMAGIKSALLSIERTSHRVILDPASTKDGVVLESTRGQYQAAWTVLKDTIYEDRLSVPPHSYFFPDCEDCEWDEKKQKVVLSNRPGAKFDMIQALAGAVFCCTNCSEPYWEYHDEGISLKEAPPRNRIYDDLAARGRRFNDSTIPEADSNLDELPDLAGWQLPDILGH